MFIFPSVSNKKSLSFISPNLSGPRQKKVKKKLLIENFAVLISFPTNKKFWILNNVKNPQLEAQKQ